VLDKPSMTVRSQPVQVATADGNEAVIASGIAPGMMVVAAGVHVLSPGQKVAIYQSKEAAAAAANAGVNAGVNSGVNSGAKASAQPVAAVAADRKEIAVGAAK
jgi:multidrug efflux system membrane fusion protein